MAEERVQRRLAAILAADVVGYSRLIEADEEGTRARMRSLHAELIDPRIAADRGRIVKSTGDGVLVEFPSAIDAVRNALAIQAEMRHRNADVPENQRISFRVGINVGDVIVEGDDIHGEGVNVAARLEGLCEPSEVYVSGSVFDQVAGKVDARFDDLGEQTVKNMARPVRVYRARVAPSASADATPSGPSLALPDKPSIAVLPFTNMSGDPEQEFFSDGITEDIITAISRIRQFFVIARNTTFTYKGRAVDVPSVARELGVRYVLEGSVRKAGNRIRITTQLIDGQSGNHIWADRYDRDLEDIFAVQDEITGSIAAQLEPELGRAEYERVRQERPDDLDAWALYHRGMSHYQKWTREENLEARELFRAAVDRDPNFAPAHAGLAWTYSQERFYGVAESDIAAGVDFGRRAVSLDDKNAFAHLALGRALHLGGDSLAGRAECELALRLNPNSAAAHVILGLIFLTLQDAEKAVSYISQGVRLSPFDPEIGVNLSRLGNAYLAAGQYELAVSHVRQSIGNWRHWYPLVVLVSALGHLGRMDEAQREIDALERIRPGCSVRFVTANWPPLNSAYVAHLLDGLRKAGLPE